jgi:hypothetical protein
VEEDVSTQEEENSEKIDSDLMNENAEVADRLSSDEISLF